MPEVRTSELRVTVLVLTRDRAEDLRYCLEALEAAQGRDSFEILVVDNGSVDATRDVTASFPQVNTLRLPKNFGSTRALNIGIRTAKGEFVLICGPEFRVRSDAVEDLRLELEAKTDAGAVCPYTEVVYSLPGPNELRSAINLTGIPGAEKLEPNSGVVAVDYPRGAPMLVRRTFLYGMNFFDERYGEYWWDLELCWQIKNANKKIYVRTDVPGPKEPHLPSPSDPIESADYASGAASFLSKHQGVSAGMAFRTGAIFSSLGRVLTFRDPGYNFRRLTGLLSGQKIDGTQA